MVISADLIICLYAIPYFAKLRHGYYAIDPIKANH